MSKERQVGLLVNNDLENATVCFVGDLSLAARVGKKINNVVGFSPLKPVHSILHAHDLAVANLENPYSKSQKTRRGQAHVLVSPPCHLDVVGRAGFKVLTLANNHILDLGTDGLRDTIEALERNGFLHTGAGVNLEAARHPAIASVGAVKFGFLAYAMKGAHSAGAGHPGTAYVERECILHDVGELKKSVDHVVVCLHVGFEFVDYPDPKYRMTCRDIVEAGASTVIGHHPHVLNGIEQYKGGLIAYSLGNFIFDTEIMDLATERANESVILSCSYNKRSLASFKLFPTVINDELEVVPADDGRRVQILDRVEVLGRRLSSGAYPQVYHEQVRNLWPKINIAVNWRILKRQGLRAMLVRLPRLKFIYVQLALGYLLRVFLQKVQSKAKQA